MSKSMTIQGSHTNVIKPHCNPKYKYSHATLLMKKFGLREGNSSWLIGSEWGSTKTWFLPPDRGQVNQMGMCGIFS